MGKFAIVNVNKEQKVYIYPKCSHVVIFDENNDMVESFQMKELEFVEVHYEEK